MSASVIFYGISAVCFIVKMITRRFFFIDVTLWALMLHLLQVPHVEMRVDESTRPNQLKQPPASTPMPEPHKQYLNNGGKCFHMPRSECPAKPGCIKVDSMSVFCCDLDRARLDNALISTFTQNTRYLHVRNSTLDVLNLSHPLFRQLTSVAFTDGNIEKIDGAPYDRQTDLSIACLNISSNNLMVELQPYAVRQLERLTNLEVLDISTNNFLDFPLIYLEAMRNNRTLSVDLSGNNYIPCRLLLNAMEMNPLLTIVHYEDTSCALKVSYNWFEDVSVVKLKHLKLQREIDASCRNIKPANINCTCTRWLEFLEDRNVVSTVSVDCSHQQLKVMPTDLPPNTVKLNVSYNNITSLQNVNDPSYDHLRDLIVDYNDVANILELEGTKFIDNFMVLSLAYNKLNTIETYVLSYRLDTGRMGPVILLAGNIIHCDCNTAKILKPWLLEKSRNIPDFKLLKCADNTPVFEIIETNVCSS